MGDGMVAHFDADPASAHLVGDRRRRAGAEERVEHEVAGVGGDLNDSVNKSLRFRSAETHIRTKKGVGLLLGFISVPCVRVRPPSPRNQAFNLRQKSDNAWL